MRGRHRTGRCWPPAPRPGCGQPRAGVLDHLTGA